jgi:hypothetical protein
MLAAGDYPAIADQMVPVSQAVVGAATEPETAFRGRGSPSGCAAATERHSSISRLVQSIMAKLMANAAFEDDEGDFGPMVWFGLRRLLGRHRRVRRMSPDLIPAIDRR